MAAHRRARQPLRQLTPIRLGETPPARQLTAAALVLKEAARMPSRETVEAFIADVIGGDHVGAIARWYAPDASMQENQAEPRVGREALIAGEEKVLARVAGVETELLAPPLIDGDQVAIRWRFTFALKDGGRLRQEEIAWQAWRGDRIWRETFFYDPAQMTAVQAAIAN
jgi:Flp pilus assembly protein CpaB